MEQDFTKGLSVCIGNYGYYNEGELHYTWITLPKMESEIRDFLHLNRLQDPLHEEIYISDYDGVPFGTRLLFNEFCHLEDLNLLAKQLVTANPADLEKVGAWIQANDTPESLVGLMNLIEQADDIPFYSWGYVSIPLRFIIAHHPKGRKCPLLCLLVLSCHRSRLNPPFLYFSL